MKRNATIATVATIAILSVAAQAFALGSGTGGGRMSMAGSHPASPGMQQGTMSGTGPRSTMPTGTTSATMQQLHMTVPQSSTTTTTK
ncbi:hypothetical protein OR1_03169 [Geobacter sp. OR-1]|uniref:hypothetical protein n=1 Tax=Geobacter sp. OR-1 TaxID=1266765 RepID=UPI0005438A73|nr:hypothetical protein [Geobacter sp. OR-1]GAM10869.1 hypothetical protein OR1_03169 [Geobacter sp. OR-1]